MDSNAKKRVTERLVALVKTMLAQGDLSGAYRRIAIEILVDYNPDWEGQEESPKADYSAAPANVLAPVSEPSKASEPPPVIKLAESESEVQRRIEKVLKHLNECGQDHLSEIARMLSVPLETAAYVLRQPGFVRLSRGVYGARRVSRYWDFSKGSPKTVNSVAVDPAKFSTKVF